MRIQAGLLPDVATGNPIQQDQIIESNKHRGSRTAIEAPLAAARPGTSAIARR